jgi:hypothetical protein
MKMEELEKLAIADVKVRLRRKGYNMRGLDYEVSFCGYGFDLGQYPDGRSIIIQEIVKVEVRRNFGTIYEAEMGIPCAPRPFNGFDE